MTGSGIRHPPLLCHRSLGHAMRRGSSSSASRSVKLIRSGYFSFPRGIDILPKGSSALDSHSGGGPDWEGAGQGSTRQPGGPIGNRETAHEDGPWRQAPHSQAVNEGLAMPESPPHLWRADVG
jgi:hypothetical protein